MCPSRRTNLAGLSSGVRNLRPPLTESPVVRWVRRVIIVTAAIHVVLSLWSLYRRIWQVQRIELIAPATVLTPSDTVGYAVITSGEVHNRIRLAHVQGDTHEVLIEQRARVNRISAYDPRIFRYTPKVALSAGQRSRFRDGPATLRLTVFGGQKLLHTPAPRVREQEVRLDPLP